MDTQKIALLNQTQRAFKHHLIMEQCIFFNVLASNRTETLGRSKSFTDVIFWNGLNSSSWVYLYFHYGEILSLDSMVILFSQITVPRFFLFKVSRCFLWWWWLFLFILHQPDLWASLVAQSIKSQPAMQEMWLQSLGREDRLEKEMATHSSILAWKIPMDRQAWWSTIHGVAIVGHNLETKRQRN